MVVYEIYKLLKRPFIIFSLIAILIFSIFVNYLYLKDGLLNNLYNNFMNEYIVLIMGLSMFLSSLIISEEYIYKTISFIKNKRVYFACLISLIIYIIFILLVSILTCFIITYINGYHYFYKINDLKNIIITFIKYFPMVIIINQIVILLSNIVHKSAFALGITYAMYFSSLYLQNRFIRHNFMKYLFIFNWNLNNIYSGFSTIKAIIIDVVVFILLYIITVIIIKKNNNKIVISQ